MSEKRKYMLRIYTCFWATVCAACGIVYVGMASAVDIPIPSPQDVAAWPPSVVLGAVCLTCCLFAYKTWVRSWEIMHEMTSEIRQLRELIAVRPCVMDKPDASDEKGQ